MAKITPIDVIKSMSGKISQDSDIYCVTNPQTGKMHTQHTSSVKIEKTENQEKVMSRFKMRTQLCSKWFAENKPSEKNPGGTEAYWKMYYAQKHQSKIGSLQHFVKDRMDDEGNVNMEGL